MTRKPGSGRNPKWCAEHRDSLKSADSLTTTCSESSCERPARARGVCNLHYKRILRAEGKLQSVWDDRRRNNHHARRARILGGAVGDPVVLAEILQRDGITCQGCAEPVDLDLTYPHPLSRSIDHIVPLSRGGAHELSNTQLMHLRCNLSKGARVA